MTKTYTLDSIGKSVDDLVESIKHLAKIWDARFEALNLRLDKVQGTVDTILEENRTTNYQLNNHEDRITILEEKVD